MQGKLQDKLSLIKQPKLWVFDIDGTLVDTFQKVYEGTNEFLRIHEISVSKDWVRDNVFYSTLPEALRKIDYEFDLDDEYEIELDDFNAELKRFSECLAGAAYSIKINNKVPELIERLLSDGKDIALATSANGIEAEPSIRLLEKEIGKFWKSYVNLDKVYNNPKPHPKSMDMIFSDVGYRDRFVIVGDGDKDILLGQNTDPKGMTIHLNKDINLPKTIKADYTFKDINDLCLAYAKTA